MKLVCYLMSSFCVASDRHQLYMKDAPCGDSVSYMCENGGGAWHFLCTRVLCPPAADKRSDRHSTEPNDSYFFIQEVNNVHTHTPPPKKKKNKKKQKTHVSGNTRPNG